MKKLLSALLVTFAVVGSVYAESNHRVSASAVTTKVSESATASVRVEPQNGYKINEEFPAKLTLTAPQGVTLEKVKLTKGDAAQLDKSALVFNVKLTATEAGKKTVTGELRFAVCKETECVPTTQAVSIQVDAK